MPGPHVLNSAFVAASSVGTLAGVLAAQIGYRAGVSGWTSTFVVSSIAAVVVGFAWSRVAAFQMFLTILSPAALVVPAVYHRLSRGRPDSPELKLDTEIAVVLFVTYCLSLVFTLRTHRSVATVTSGQHRGSDGRT